jgi:hypothetical protein
MIRKETWFVLIVCALLIGYAVYLNNQKKASSGVATPLPASAFLINASEGQPTSIEVKSADGQSVKLVRGTAGWTLELPEKTEANQASAEAAATQVTSLQVVDEITGDASIFGLDKPAFVITVEIGSAKKHVLEIGDQTPTKTGYYVRLDGGRMAIVAQSGIDPLTGLLTSPPYLNTPTPSPIPPTATPIPATEAGPTVTPTP